MAGTPHRLGRLWYALAASAAVLSQHVVLVWAYWSAGAVLKADAEFWLAPLRVFARLPDVHPAGVPVALLCAILSAGAAAWLSILRARDAGGGYVFAALTLIPGAQVPAILALSLLPPAASPIPRQEGGASLADAVVGVVAGMGLCVFAVAVSALVFGIYGYGVFVLAPVLMGLVTGYMANRRADLSARSTMNLALLSAILGGFMLVAFALEGIICLIMAAPLALACAGAGGAIGREMAIRRGRGGHPAAFSVAILPLVLAIEATVPSQLRLASVETVDIDASPVQVWRAVTADGEIGPAPPAPFRLGLGYPIASELRGEGVGAERIGRFSTGVSRERVTAWEPGRRLTFEVLETPPAMRELSPWPTVHAPHAVGYFHTLQTSFELAPSPGGRTRLTIRSAHVLRLDPVPYWEPMARLAIQANNRRVLAHMKRQAEGPMTVAAAQPRPAPTT
ncbi:SRPBCC family protein [Phenylobacterium sp.]|uniref:SRPBCC family protein n=1 Tax=Phenylobacterium sp. TaxID=1871053 RepID=UPI00301C27CE